MPRHSLFGAPEAKVHACLSELFRKDRGHTVEILRVLAVVDLRKLYRPYPSLYLYCVERHGLAEYEAYLRILAARAARRFPTIYDLVENGRLTLTSIRLLAPYLREDTAPGLLAAACGKKKRELQALLAERFPRPDVPTSITLLNPASEARWSIASPDGVSARLLGPDPVGTVEAAEVAAPTLVYQAPAPPARVEPIAPQRFALQTTISERARDLMQRAQELLGHAVAPGDVGELIERAMELLVEHAEKEKFGSQDSPRPRAVSDDGDHIPVALVRQVWERDRGQCTHPGCSERTLLQVHHEISRARGGLTTLRNLRLLCPGHHAIETERVFGVGLVEGKIERARMNRPG